ncbi:hypothetical protein GGR56DRAFT_444613 [Xylariaceae sp. FL0804]|nr:hypothetical protein GGR56DRAFT_444613 [Xylariaceae sp. FL0804]
MHACQHAYLRTNWNKDIVARFSVFLFLFFWVALCMYACSSGDGTAVLSALELSLSLPHPDQGHREPRRHKLYAAYRSLLTIDRSYAGAGWLGPVTTLPPCLSGLPAGLPASSARRGTPYPSIYLIPPPYRADD